MTMGKSAAVGAVAILLLAGGAFLVVERLTAEPVAVRPPRAKEAPAVAAEPAPAAPPAASPRALPPPAVVASAKADLLVSLNAARLRILECGRLARQAVPAEERERRDQERQDAGASRTALLLELVPKEDQVTVRSAEPSVAGEGDEDLIRCAQHELVGKVLDARAFKQGPPQKMRFVVDERRR